jgi:hypothetical protein
MTQLLVPRDIQDFNDPEADDNIPTYNGSVYAQDDEPDDRTHRADIDGNLLVQYQPTGTMGIKEFRMPVCRRDPDERRKVLLRVHVFLEPFKDIGYDHDGDPTTPPIGADDGVFSFSDLNANGHDPGEPSEPFDDANSNGARDPGETYQDIGYDHDNNPTTPVIGAGDGIFSYSDQNGNGHDPGEPSEPYLDLSEKQYVTFRGGNEPNVQSGRSPVTSRLNQVDDDIVRANIAWSPGCIMFELLDGEILIESAPLYQGKDIIADASISIMPKTELGETTPSDLKVIFDYFRDRIPMTEDIVDVFYAALPEGTGGGYTMTPLSGYGGEVNSREISFITLDPGNEIYRRSLAHELGHVLTNRNDFCPNDIQYFFPQDISCPSSTGQNDDRQHYMYRRIDETTLEHALKRRDPGAPYNEPGNHVLKPR